MRKIISTIFLFMFFFSLSANAQYNYVKNFPSDDFFTNKTKTTGAHGVAVDPAGNVWMQFYGVTDTVLDVHNGKKIGIRQLFVYKPDGTQLPFSPINYITVNGVQDTLFNSGRGLGINSDGNILATFYDAVYVIDYKTGAGLGKVLPVPGATGIKAEGDDNGNIATGCVIPPQPIKIYDAALSLTSTVTTAAPGYSRALTISGDGNTVYWPAYSSHKIYIFNRANEFDNWKMADSIEGCSAGSIARAKANGRIWFDGGSNDAAYTHTNGFSANTWYAWDPDAKKATDSLKWHFTTPDNAAETPRGVAASPTGDTVYVACFGASNYPAFEMFVKGASSAVPVTFQVDMSVAEAGGSFKPASDKVVVRGSFQTDAGDTGDWQGTAFTLTDPNNDKIYTTTANMPGSKAGTQYQFKYVIVSSSDAWESIDNRTFTLASSAQTLPVVFFNNVAQQMQDYTITFQADMSELLVATPEPFNPTTDTLKVDGLDWFGASNIRGDRVLKAVDPFNPTLYSATLTITPTSDSTKWKFHGYPTSKFGNSGYELGGDRWIYYKNLSGTTVTLDPIKPNVALLGKEMANDQPVLFQVDLNGAKNVYNGSAIEKSKINFVGVKGAPALLGAWGGSWVVADTAGTAPTMVVLHDDGKFGDKVAGDNVWSRMVTFPAKTREGNIEFKFGCWYEGAASATTNTAILDNEGGFGYNHVYMLRQKSGAIELRYSFGDYVNSVKETKLSGIPTNYALGQNYPNPFNPSTKITYSVPQNSFVTLKVYNMLGQVVAQLINTQKSAGNYEVAFDASRLSSGVYMYTIQAGKFSATKKMMLIK